MAMVKKLKKKKKEAVAQQPKVDEVRQAPQQLQDAGISSAPSKVKKKQKKKKSVDMNPASEPPKLAASSKGNLQGGLKQKKKKAFAKAAEEPVPKKLKSEDLLKARPGELGCMRTRADSEDIAPVTEESAKADSLRALNLLEQVLQQEGDPAEISEEELQAPATIQRKKDSALERKIFVGGLPFKVDPETVEKDFETCGEIDSFNMPMNKQTGKPMGIAFIVFASKDGVNHALLYNGKNYRGQKLRVSLADREAKGKDAHKAIDGDKSKGSQPAESHTGKGKQKGKGKNKDGSNDWMCPSCGDHQFGRNETCRKCGGPKPGGSLDKENGTGDGTVKSNAEGKGKSKANVAGKGKGKGKEEAKGKGKDKHKGSGKDKGKGKHKGMSVDRDVSEFL